MQMLKIAIMNNGFILGAMFACYIKDNIHYKIYGSFFLIGKEYGVSNGDYHF